MNEAFPYDAGLHLAGTIAASGRCSQHSTAFCFEPPVISFREEAAQAEM